MRIPESDFLNDEIKYYLSLINKVHYYGAGTSAHGARGVIQSIFDPYHVSDIQIYSDMMAACRATCGSNKGLVGILGTGTNSCYYDGENIHVHMPSMGFLIGDQGSGNYIGRMLLQAYFFNKMPNRIKSAFQDKYALTKESIITELYSSATPAKYLGQFVYFLQDLADEWRTSFLQNIFREFVDLYFGDHPQKTMYELHFVGSIAYHFQKELKTVCNEFGITTGAFLKSPSTKLIEYHIKNYE